MKKNMWKIPNEKENMKKKTNRKILTKERI